MYGIVTLLDDKHTARVEALWEELQKSCGLTCIQMAPLPHFSWHIAEEYDFDRLEDKLAHIAKKTKPFTIHTAGMGLFTGEKPVVYIQIVKDRRLLDLHQHIWEEIQPISSGINLLYAPDQWMPHITLANQDVNDDILPCIFSTLVWRAFTWEIEVNCFALGFQNEDTPGEITKTFPLNPS
ncbi:MAG: 2'-5' RNA ligase family protein [Anaerolineales bacterium]|jgi:2'-5' RNA ligase